MDCLGPEAVHDIQSSKKRKTETPTRLIQLPQLTVNWCLHGFSKSDHFAMNSRANQDRLLSDQIPLHLLQVEHCAAVLLRPASKSLEWKTWLDESEVAYIELNPAVTRPWLSSELRDYLDQRASRQLAIIGDMQDHNLLAICLQGLEMGYHVFAICLPPEEMNFETKIQINRFSSMGVTLLSADGFRAELSLTSAARGYGPRKQ
jgi:hypothetical protein